MKVTIKDFSIDMEVKTRGIEFEVRTPDGEDHLGDLVVNKTGLTWCQGKTQPENGIKMSWQAFIDCMVADAKLADALKLPK